MSGKIKVITKSEHFIYFVTEEDKNENWHFNIALNSTSCWEIGDNLKNAVFENGLYVIMKIKLALRHQPNYMKLNACVDSPYKMKDLKPEHRREIKKAIINTNTTYENESILYYDYAIVLWEELNDKEKIYLYETPNQELAWTTAPLSKEQTNLAMNVELVMQSMGKIENEPPYILVQNDYDDKSNLNWVKVRLDGTPLNDEQLVFDEECEMYELKQWIELNKLPILMYWTQEENSYLKISKMIRPYYFVSPKLDMFPEDFDGKQIISATELEQYFDSIKDKIIGKTIDKIFYTGLLYNRDWDINFEYKNGEWYSGDKKSDEPSLYPWKESNSVLWLDMPVILDFEGTRLEIRYTTGSLVKVNTNSIDTDTYGADVSKHFIRHIIGHKLVDIKIHKTKHVYFMNFSSLGIERNEGDDMFEEIWFVFDNGHVLELTTDSCDYTVFSERESGFKCPKD